MQILTDTVVHNRESSHKCKKINVKEFTDIYYSVPHILWCHQMYSNYMTDKTLQNVAGGEGSRDQYLDTLCVFGNCFSQLPILIEELPQW